MPMLEVKWPSYDEQDSPFYLPPKPKDYYTSKGIWDIEPKKEGYTSSLSDFLGMLAPSKDSKKW